MSTVTRYPRPCCACGEIVWEPLEDPKVTCPHCREIRDTCVGKNGFGKKMRWWEADRIASYIQEAIEHERKEPRYTVAEIEAYLRALTYSSLVQIDAYLIGKAIAMLPHPRDGIAAVTARTAKA